MLVAIHGCLRVSELTYLTFDDVRKDGCKFAFVIRQSKTDQSGVGHEFVVTPSFQEDLCPCRHIQEYINLYD